MKKVEAIIRPEMLPVVRKALEEQGVTGVTITQVLGHGAQGGITQQWKGNSYKVDLLPKVELKMIVADGLVEAVLDGDRRVRAHRGGRRWQSVRVDDRRSDARADGRAR